MKSFEIYLIEEDLIKTIDISRKQLYCEGLLKENFQVNEFLSLLPSMLGLLGSSKPKDVESEVKEKDKKLFVIEFLKSSVKKLGLLVVIGALLYLGIKTGIIAQLLSWAGTIIKTIVMWIVSLTGDKIKAILEKAYEAFNGFVVDTASQINDKTGEAGEYLKDLFKKGTGTFGNPDVGNSWKNPQETDFLGRGRTILTPKEDPKPIDWDGINDFFRDKKLIDPGLLK